MEIIEEARRLGLNSYEAKVYLALMERDSLSVSDVSKISRVPRARIYDILDSLAANGLATLKPGRYKKYCATDPALFEGKLISQNEEKYVERKNIIEKATLVLKKKFESRNNNGFNSSDRLEFIEIIRDSYQIHKRFMGLVAQAKVEILGFSKPPYFGSREQRKDQMEQQADLCEKGIIRHRGIHVIPKTKEEIRWRLEVLNRTVRDNDETRVIAELPMKMFVFDEKIAMYALEDPISGETSFTMQVIEHRALAKSLKMLFYHVWEQAEDYHVLEDLLKEGL